MNHKLKVSIVISLAVIFVCSSLPLKAADYSLDPAHTSLVFRAKHMDIGYVYGMFLDVSGDIEYEPGEPTDTTMDIRAKTDSVFTNVKKRDNHLKGTDFFNAEQYPEIKFVSKSVEAEDDNTLSVTGDLTLRGVSQEKTINVELTGSGKGPQGKFRRGFHTTFTINRMNYNMDYMPSGISKTIKLIFSGEAIRQ